MLLLFFVAGYHTKTRKGTRREMRAHARRGVGRGGRGVGCVCFAPRKNSCAWGRVALSENGLLRHRSGTKGGWLCRNFFGKNSSWKNLIPQFLFVIDASESVGVKQDLLGRLDDEFLLSLEFEMAMSLFVSEKV